MMNNVSEFVEYALDFYGPGMIHDINATETEVLRALCVRLVNRPDLEFDGDSLDREMVRDIIIEMRKVV
jgi:hypothetical protein